MAPETTADDGEAQTGPACVRCEHERDAEGTIDHAPGCPVQYKDKTTDGRTCDECRVSLTGDENHPHESGCSHERGVVDPYAGETETINETPL